MNEFIATMVLSTTVLALGDDQNAPPGAGMNAFIIGIVVTQGEILQTAKRYPASPSTLSVSELTSSQERWLSHNKLVQR